MRLFQSSVNIPLSAVKPLDGLLRYRAHCLEGCRRALTTSRRRRERSPWGGAPLEFYGDVEGFEYVRCPETGSLFLAEVAEPQEWAGVLKEVIRYRHSPQAFHMDIAKSRADNVYQPKLDWIVDALRFQGIAAPRVIEVTTPPSDLSPLLQSSPSIAEVSVLDEMELVREERGGPILESSHAAVLLESLDRVPDPLALLTATSRHLMKGGLLFVTALVCSGFDMAVLGRRNFYLYPPDRTNCFSIAGLERLLSAAGFSLVEVSTPGVLDVEIVETHLRHDQTIPLSTFERELLASNRETKGGFQEFLQQHRLSSFARLVGRKQG